MSYADTIYNKRVNRNGNNHSERLESGRQKNFEYFLAKSPYATTFEYKGATIEAIFKQYRQNETKTVMNLLTRVGIEFNSGDIVTILNDKYMFYYLEEKKESGYNRWVLLKMTHTISWTLEENGQNYSSDAYLYFQQDSALQDQLESSGRSTTLYFERDKFNYLMMPLSDKIAVDAYVTITTMGIEQHFIISGYDIVSTPGMMYVTLNPTFERDITPAPEQEETDDPNDFFWLKGE